MIVGFHYIFTAYGFWLPNDPRGSWSSVIRQFELLKYGPPTKVETRRSLAGRPHDRQHRLQAKRAIKYPPVVFTGQQAREIARGYSVAVQQENYRIHALAVLPQHVHLVMAWHLKHTDLIAGHLKSKATRQLNLANLNPMAQFAKNDRLPSPWARNHWCVFVDNQHQMRQAIAYTERNPLREGLHQATMVVCRTVHMK